MSDERTPEICETGMLGFKYEKVEDIIHDFFNPHEETAMYCQGYEEEELLACKTNLDLNNRDSELDKELGIMEVDEGENTSPH
jgi:hypothetical protein